MKNSSKMAARDDFIYDQVEEALRLARTSGAPENVISAIATAKEMILNKNAYDNNATSDQSKTCQHIEEQTYSHDWDGAFKSGNTPSFYETVMLCGRVEGQFLKSLVSMNKPKRILEVGMFTGFSACSMAEALPADGEIVSLDICGYLKPLVEELTKDSPHRHKMKCIIGNATDEMKKMVTAGEKFNMVFLDGDKEDYTDQFKILFDENLLSPGGTLLIDNAYGIGDVYIPPLKPSPATELLDAIKERPYLHRVMVPMNDGVLIVRRMVDVEGATV